MKLDEAIQCERVKIKHLSEEKGNLNACLSGGLDERVKCLHYHEQLAEWLTELKELHSNTWMKCPHCGTLTGKWNQYIEDVKLATKYCPVCGKEIIWSDAE